MTNSNEDAKEDGPLFGVWSNLHSGVELAEMELDALDDQTRKAVEAFGRHFVRMRKAFAIPEADQTIADFLDLLFQDPWYRHAAEIELAWDGIGRASQALGRFGELQPVFTNFELGPKAAGYLREVIDTFLFGFDGACVALCGATLEQILRQLVVTRELYTEKRLKAERPSGFTLLQQAKRNGMISDARAAGRVLEARNRVMHKHVWEKKIIHTMALDCIQNLGTVLVQLHDEQPSDSHL